MPLPNLAKIHGDVGDCQFVVDVAKGYSGLHDGLVANKGYLYVGEVGIEGFYICPNHHQIQSILDVLRFGIFGIDKAFTFPCLWGWFSSSP